MEKPDEGYDSTGEVSSLLIVVVLFSNVVDCRPSQESGLLINQSKSEKFRSSSNGEGPEYCRTPDQSYKKAKSSDLHQKARGRRRSRRRARDSSRRERLHREEVLFDIKRF